eukprot:s119_g66.t1
MLATASVNCDAAFGLAFTGRNDDRQKRSLLQPGTIVMPNTSDNHVSEGTWQYWRNSDLFRFNLVKDAVLPLSSELVEIEDLSELALPSTTDASTHPPPAEKFQQIGIDAAQKLLSAATSNLAAEAERTALLVVDLSSRTMEFAKATYALRKISTIWASAKQIASFLEGKLPLPSGAQPLGPAELPAELVSAMPSKPELGTLTWSSKKQDGLPTLKTPDKVLQAWHHPEFGGQMQDWLKKARAALPLDLPDEKNKRNVTETAGAEAASSAATAETVTAANRVKTGAASNLPCIAQAGKFVLQKEREAAEAVREADVLYKLQDANDRVILDGTFTTVGKIIKEKRALSPLEVKVLYHDLADKPKADDATFFELSTKHQVLFRPESAPVKEEQKGAEGHVKLSYTSLAGCVDTSVWQNLATEIVWSVRWTARGLSPVRPRLPESTVLGETWPCHCLPRVRVDSDGRQQITSKKEKHAQR